MYSLSINQFHSSDLNTGNVEFRKSYSSYSFIYFIRNSLIQLAMSVLSIYLDIHRHRILTGDSI